MKIYRECDVVVGSILKNSLIAFIKSTRGQVVLSKGPPIGECYFAETFKQIDVEIVAHMQQVIKGEE